MDHEPATCTLSADSSPSRKRISFGPTDRATTARQAKNALLLSLVTLALLWLGLWLCGRLQLPLNQDHLTVAVVAETIAALAILLVGSVGTLVLWIWAGFRIYWVHYHDWSA